MCIRLKVQNTAGVLLWLVIRSKFCLKQKQNMFFGYCEFVIVMLWRLIWFLMILLYFCRCLKSFKRESGTKPFCRLCRICGKKTINCIGRILAKLNAKISKHCWKMDIALHSIIGKYIHAEKKGKVIVRPSCAPHQDNVRSKRHGRKRSSTGGIEWKKKSTAKGTHWPPESC